MKTRVLQLTSLLVLAGMMLSLSACGGGATPVAVEPTLPAVLAESSIVAEGQVVPVQSATLSFSAIGVLDESPVKEGDTVEADGVIARLKGGERMQAAVAAAEMELLSAQQALADLNTTAELARAQAELKLAEAEKNLDKATKRRNSRDYKWGDQEQIDIAWSNYILAQDAVENAEEDYNGVASRAEDDPARAALLSILANTRQARDKALQNYNFLVGLPNELEVNEADAQLKLAEAQVQSAEDELAKVKDGPDTDDLTLVQARIHNAEAQLAAAKAALEDLALNAPFAGTIVSTSLKEGELVSAGTSPVILADLSKWQVETTDLTELNVVSIQVGEPVTIQFDALPDLTLTGKVSRIKALGENRQGDVTYQVVIDLDEQNPDLRWNMTASVTFEAE